MTLDRWIPLNLGMLELRVKIDKDGLVFHVRWAPWLCWAQINTPSHGASPGLSALAWKRLCCTHREGTELSDSSLLQLRQEKAPLQHASPKSRSWNQWDSRNGKNREQSREVLRDLVVRSFSQNQKISAGHPSLTHGWIARLSFHNTFRSFLLCFSHFSPPSAVPRAHLKYHLA